MANAELAFNEQDNILYYGWGTGGAGGTATQCPGIGGDGMGNTDPSKILMNGTQSAGNDLKWARANHVHPTDTSRAPTASPTLTGTVTVTGIAAVTANSASPALQVTQTGSGHALLVEDSANPDSTPFTISTGGYVGIGTTTPVVQLDIRNGSINHTYNSANSTGSVIRLQKGRGTADTPTIALTGDQLGSLLFEGHNGTLFTGGAMIAALTPSGSAVSATNLPGQLDFYTTPVGSTVLSLAMSLLSTGVMDVNYHKIVNLANPTNPQDAATKAYVDAARAGLDVKDSCRVATTGSVGGGISNTTTIGGTPNTLDGVSLVVGNRVLVKNQTAASENGLYEVTVVGTGSNGTWTRSGDTLTSGAFTFIEEGTVNADSGWVLTTDGVIIQGSTALTYAQFSGAGQIIAGAGLTKSGNTLDINVGSGANSAGLEIVSDQLKVKLGAHLAFNGTTGAVDVQTGTSGAAIPLLNASNSWSGTQFFSNTVNYIGQFGSNSYIEFNTSANYPLIDFHCSNTNVDYNVRIYVTGDETGLGLGIMQIQCGALMVNNVAVLNANSVIDGGSY